MNKYAVIDIGSNSVRYGEEASGRIPVKEVYTTRLGGGLAKTGLLPDEAMEKSLEVMKELSRRAKENGFVPVGYATSAVRDAVNGREFAERVESECGFPVEILPGEFEARLAFLGASGSGGFDTMIDIGGASMQVVTRDFGASFRAGCVRCSDIAREKSGASSPDEDPLAQRQAVNEYIDGIFSLPEFAVGRLVGVGGTITTLAALEAGLRDFDARTVENTVLTPDSLEKLIARLIEEGGARREHPLLRERHDVILYGAYILAYALKKLNAYELSVSCADGMEGYLMKVKNHGNI
ncbi:MAG: hypothetical protein K6F68_06935 [Clostridiales bacterium]|nr:hypothetical protein [Clostridiales bacterium]